MKYRFLLPAFSLFIIFSACHQRDNSGASKPENDIDAARDFIRDALDGKFDDARKYLYPDSSNFSYMAVAQRNYQNAREATKQGYRASSINIHQVTPVNDSTTVIIFSNSYMNDHDTLKILKVSGLWLIDLKYLYEHDLDTTTKLGKPKVLRP